MAVRRPWTDGMSQGARDGVAMQRNMAEWQSGYAAACKAVDLGSIPGSASILYIKK